LAVISCGAVIELVWSFAEFLKRVQELRSQAREGMRMPAFRKAPKLSVSAEENSNSLWSRLTTVAAEEEFAGAADCSQDERFSVTWPLGYWFALWGQLALERRNMVAPMRGSERDGGLWEGHTSSRMDHLPNHRLRGIGGVL